MNLQSRTHFPLQRKVFSFDANCIIASLGIKSLLTNIAFDEAIENGIHEIFLKTMHFKILRKKISKKISDLLPMSYYSYLITNVIPN